MPEVTPAEQVLGAGAGGPLTAPGPWIQEKDTTSEYIQYAKGVVVGSPLGGNQGPGTVNSPAYYINGVLVQPNNYLLLAGGTMTGLLVLSGDPSSAYGAVTKRYVDNINTILTGTFANYLPLIGGTLTGPLFLQADPTTNLQAATKQYVDNKDALGVPLAGGTMTGPLILSGDPTVALGAVTKQYSDKHILLTGGTMTGLLTLSADPTAVLGAATKQYVDGRISTVNATFANYVPLAGGVAMTGFLTLNADPTTSLQAATKHYCDVLFASAGLTIPDAPADGSTYGRNNNAWSNVIDPGTF